MKNCCNYLSIKVKQMCVLSVCMYIYIYMYIYNIYNVYIIYMSAYVMCIYNISFLENWSCFQYFVFIITLNACNFCRNLGLLYFLLVFLVFSLRRFYIYPVGYCCMFFRFNFSFSVNNDLLKKLL